MFTVRLTICGQVVLSEPMFDSARACGAPGSPFVSVTSAMLWILSPSQSLLSQADDNCAPVDMGGMMQADYT